MRSRLNKNRWIGSVLTLALACSETTTEDQARPVPEYRDAAASVMPPDGGQTMDASTTSDAGFTDSGYTDASFKDAESIDAGLADDADLADVEFADAELEDAFGRDAANPDAAALDAALVDTGPTGPGPFVVSTASATQSRVQNYDRPITAGNPLKGFLTSYQWTTPDQRIPHQMEFVYVPLSDVLVAANQYDFASGLEPHLIAAANRNNHLVVRFYADYPGRPPGLPAWLTAQINCSPYMEYGGGCSPDYSDSQFQTTILNFIAEFGAQYDGDPRLGFIQLGILGFWGEWHTFPHTTYFASNGFQRQVIDAFDQAFNRTRLMIRYPIHDSPQRDFGFHDDSFAYATIGTVPWFFHPRMMAAGADTRWQQGPIGGEVYPQLQDSIFTPSYVVDTYSQDFIQCIEDTHTSWMINNGAFRAGGGYTGTQLDGARVAALTMGYEYAIPNFSIEASGLYQGAIDVAIEVDITNTGVAPFYYPLTLILEDDLGNTATLADDLQTLQPQNVRTLRFTANNVDPDYLRRNFSLRLGSSILLPNQKIRFADQADMNGRLSFEADFTCSWRGRSLNLGEEADDCYCDADGQMIDQNAVRCIE